MKTDKIIIQVSGVVYSEKSIGALVDLRFDERGECMAASRLVWFPKSLCDIEEMPPVENGKFKRYFISAPMWLIEKNNIKIEQNDKI